MRKPTIWVPTRSDTNQAVQPQKMAIGLYLSRRGINCTIYVAKSKGADQLSGYREADLRLCFRPSILLVFLCSGLIGLYCYFRNWSTNFYDTIYYICAFLCNLEFL